MLKLYVVFFHIHIFFWNYNSEPAQKIRLNIAPIEIAQCRTYVQWLWQPRTTQPPEQPQPGGHFSVKLLLCKVARQRHPCVSASLQPQQPQCARHGGAPAEKLRGWDRWGWMRSVNKTASAENGLRLLWIRKEIQVSIRQPQQCEY